MEFFEMKPTIESTDSRYDAVKKQGPRQFHLTEDVKYVLNPNAGLAIELIDACFVLEYKGNENLFINKVSAFDTTVAIPLHAKMQSATILNTRADISLEERIKNIEESGWDLEYVSNDYPKGINSFIRFRTKYMPLQCLKNLNFVVWGGKAPRLYLKMLVRAKRKDSATAEPVTSIVTYDISQSIPKATKNAIEGSVIHHVSNGLTDYQRVWRTSPNNQYTYDYEITNLPLNNFYYNYPSSFGEGLSFPANNMFTYANRDINVSNDVNVGYDAIVANNVTIKAMGNINIGRMSQGSRLPLIGNNVTFIAGKSINISPDVILPPTTTLLTQPSNPTDIFGCNSSKITDLEATNEEVYGKNNGICNNKTYKDSTNIIYFKEEDSEDKLLKAKSDTEVLDLNVKLDCVPNPFANFFTINYELSNDQTIQIYLSNSIGQVVKSILDDRIVAGSHQIHVSTEQLPSGMYILTLRSKNGTENRKVIKQ